MSRYFKIKLGLVAKNATTLGYPTGSLPCDSTAMLCQFSVGRRGSCFPFFILTRSVGTSTTLVELSASVFS